MDWSYSHPRKRPHLDDSLMDLDPPHFTPQPPSRTSHRQIQPLPHPVFATYSSPESPLVSFKPTSDISLQLDETKIEDVTKMSEEPGSENGQTTENQIILGSAPKQPRRRTNKRSTKSSKAAVSCPPPSSHHYSLHQHHYGLDQQIVGANSSHSHWFRQDAPGVLLGYVQVLFNSIVTLLALYLIFTFVYVVGTDVREKVQGYSTEIQQEILQCSNAYVANRCHPDQRTPFMEGACSQWEHCMQRDPKIVGQARVAAETFAEVLNTFIEGISFKTMFFILSAVFVFVGVTNLTIGSVRHHLDGGVNDRHGRPKPSTWVSEPALSHHQPPALVTHH